MYDIRQWHLFTTSLDNVHSRHHHSYQLINMKVLCWLPPDKVFLLFKDLNPFLLRTVGVGLIAQNIRFANLLTGIKFVVFIEICNQEDKYDLSGLLPLFVIFSVQSPQKPPATGMMALKIWNNSGTMKYSGCMVLLPKPFQVFSCPGSSIPDLGESVTECHFWILTQRVTFDT